MGEKVNNTRRNELIRQMLDTFDTIDALRYDNRYLRERLQMYENSTPVEAEHVGFLDEHVLKYGRDELVKKVLEYWHDVKYTVDEDTEAVSVESFEKWCEHAIKVYNIPSWCSRDDFNEYFNAELRAVYEEECEKAVAEAHNER